VEEGHEPSACPPTRRQIDQLQPGGAALSQRRRQVVYAVGDMVDAGAAVGQELADRAIIAGRGQEFDMLVAAGEKHYLHPLILKDLAGDNLEPEHLLIQSKAIGKRRRRDADMVDGAEI
jgi:hypothetical protein